MERMTNSELKRPCPDCGQDCDPCEGLDGQPLKLEKRAIEYYCDNPECTRASPYWIDDKRGRKGKPKD